MVVVLCVCVFHCGCGCMCVCVGVAFFLTCTVSRDDPGTQYMQYVTMLEYFALGILYLQAI